MKNKSAPKSAHTLSRDEAMCASILALTDSTANRGRLLVLVYGSERYVGARQVFVCDATTIRRESSGRFLAVARTLPKRLGGG
jgi:hypothetical protein